MKTRIFIITTFLLAILSCRNKSSNDTNPIEDNDDLISQVISESILKTKNSFSEDLL